jgi:hypothetical protein
MIRVNLEPIQAGFKLDGQVDALFFLVKLVRGH